MEFLLIITAASLVFFFVGYKIGKKNKVQNTQSIQQLGQQLGQQPLVTPSLDQPIKKHKGFRSEKDKEEIQTNPKTYNLN